MQLFPLSKCALKFVKKIHHIFIISNITFENSLLILKLLFLGSINKKIVTKTGLNPCKLFYTEYPLLHLTVAHF